MFSNISGGNWGDGIHFEVDGLSYSLLLLGIPEESSDGDSHGEDEP